MCGNYSREETIQGRKLYEEIRYLELRLKNDRCSVFSLFHVSQILLVKKPQSAVKKTYGDKGDW